MLYDAKPQTMADELLKKGVYVIGFFVVPKDKARIRATNCSNNKHLLNANLL
jgi:hypothetical protein